MYNKKASVFKFARCTKKVFPVLFSLCILLHDLMRKGRKGVWNRVGWELGT